MKKIIYSICILSALLFATACEDNIDTWSGKNRVNFYTQRKTWDDFGLIETDTIQNFSFAFGSPDVTTATVYLEIETQGFIRDYPRAFRLAQDKSFYGAQSATTDNYVAFDNADVSGEYVIPANANRVTVPVILKRTPDLKTKSVYLRVVFEENEFFSPAFNDSRSHRTIVITDRLAKPSLWDDLSNYLGDYGEVKHQFMIDATGETIDNTYLQAILDTKDRNYYAYLRDWFQQKLDEENENRKEANGGVDNPLRENDEDKTVVSFV